MNDLHTITLISSRGGNSKTISSLFMALAAAEKGIKTILIDADLEAPSLMHLINGFNSKSSWVEYLENEKIQVADLINESHVDNLDIIFSPAPKLGKSFLGWKSNSWWKNALKRALMAKEELYKMGYRCIIIDSQSGTSYNSLNNLVFSTTSVMVIRPAGYGLGATEGILKEIFNTLKDMSDRNDYYLWTQVHEGKTEEEKEMLTGFLDFWDNRLQNLGLTKLGAIRYDNKLHLHLLADKISLSELNLSIKEDYDKVLSKLIK